MTDGSASSVAQSRDQITSESPSLLVILGPSMHVEREAKCVRFTAEDSMHISMTLNDLGIDHHCVDPGMRGLPAVMTAYYNTAEEAERLLLYLVGRASCEDKLGWQQDRAHHEIEGWCELCELANGGECDAGCLVNHRLGKHPDSLFARSALESVSSDKKKMRSRPQQ
jgi:hypothetical protein